LGKLAQESLETAAVLEKINTMFDLMNAVSTQHLGPKKATTKSILHIRDQVKSFLSLQNINTKFTLSFKCFLGVQGNDIIH
jgi:hypothetical protein